MSLPAANPTNQFNTKVAALETELTRVETELVEKCAAPIPRDVRDAQRLANKHKDWENRVQVGRRTGESSGSERLVVLRFLEAVFEDVFRDDEMFIGIAGCSHVGLVV